MATTATESVTLRHTRGVSRLGRVTGRGPRTVPTHATARFLTPDDRGWTNDGAAEWVPGHVHGLTYSGAGTGRITLHNRGDDDLGVLSVPRMPDTRDSAFSFIPAGASVTVPEASYHILQTPRIGGRPVLVGEIRVDDDVRFTVDAPPAGLVDLGATDSADHYWKPGDRDFGCARTPQLVFGDPHAAGIFHTVTDGAATIHNRGSESVGVLTVGADGPLDLVVIAAGESAPLPPVDLVCYVQGPREGGRPKLFGALWMSAGRVMPSTLPIPSRREFLDQHYLTPWSADHNGGVARADQLDADADGISFQYRSGGSSVAVRNAGDRWVAVVHTSPVSGRRVVTEVPPGSKATFEVCPSASNGQIFSIVGRRRVGTAGRAPYVSASGMVHPGWPGRPGMATKYGSVVIMLGTVVYAAIPKRNLYLAWSDRRRLRKRQGGGNTGLRSVSATM